MQVLHASMITGILRPVKINRKHLYEILRPKLRYKLYYFFSVRMTNIV